MIITVETLEKIRKSDDVEEQKKLFWNDFKKVKNKYPDVRCKYYFDENGLLARVSIFTFYDNEPQGLKEVWLDDLPFVIVKKEEDKTKIGVIALKSELFM